jgi:hypothetical protein
MCSDPIRFSATGQFESHSEYYDHWSRAAVLSLSLSLHKIGTHNALRVGPLPLHHSFDEFNHA